MAAILQDHYLGAVSFMQKARDVLADLDLIASEKNEIWSVVDPGGEADGVVDRCAWAGINHIVPFMEKTPDTFISQIHASDPDSRPEACFRRFL